MAGMNLYSAAILTQFLLLALSLVAGQLIERRRIKWIGSAGVALLLGMGVGAIVNLFDKETEYKEVIQFKSDFFFFALLPPIMFNAGFSLDTKLFMVNFGSICSFAFLGTAISTAVVGVPLWLAGRWGWIFPMSLMHSLIFGSLISATDPVTVLAVFQALGADQDLYINVFGESVLNDAVAMVLFNTISHMALPGQAVTRATVLQGAGMFVAIFLGSVAIGCLMGLLASIMFHSNVVRDHGVVVEPGLVILLAYSSYLIAASVDMSGIVSVVFCGMVMSTYTKPNLSHSSQHPTEVLCEVLGGLAELFVFSYIGLSLSIGSNIRHLVPFIGASLVVLAVSRAANILPLSALINFFRSPERRIPWLQQFMLWWSGLRGAMAFALAVGAAEQLGEVGEVMKTATSVIILVTVLVNGGASAGLLECLKLRQEDTVARIVHYQPLAPSEQQLLDDMEKAPPASHGTTLKRAQTYDHTSSPGHHHPHHPHHPHTSPLMRLVDALHQFRELDLVNMGLEQLDKKLLAPLLLPSVEEEDEEEEADEQGVVVVQEQRQASVRQKELRAHSVDQLEDISQALRSLHRALSSTSTSTESSWSTSSKSA